VLLSNTEASYFPTNTVIIYLPEYTAKQYPREDRVIKQLQMVIGVLDDSKTMAFDTQNRM
jgi:hypothetical protein